MALNQQPIPYRVYVWLPLLLAVAMVFGLLVGMQLKPQPASIEVDPLEQSGSYANGHGKMEELMRFIEAKYVDEVERDKLIDEAITSVLHQLDPHSAYIPADELQQVNEQLDGEFVGIGVEFMILDDTVVVVAAIPDGPSASAGIRPGDRIVSVGDSIIAGKGLNNENIVSLLRGEKGTTAQVGILRTGFKKPRKFNITRDEIPLQSIDAAYPLDKRTGYIRINRFSATTDKEFVEALQKLTEEHHVTDLVLDLRQNSGGYLQQAVNMLSQIFPQNGELLVYTEGRTMQRSEYVSTGRAFFDLDKIAVLIDEGTASASEILAGAIQDQDRGVIIGRRSFGKGLVQEQYQLQDGSALRLSVARYFTPSGRSIQKPYSSNIKAYQEDFANRVHNGELLSQNRIPIQDSTRYYTSGGRVVYGGGGIIPDIFVPLDTVELNPYFQDARQYIPGFAFRYLQRHRTAFPDQQTAFMRTFSVTENLLEAFRAYAEQQGLRKDDSSWRHMSHMLGNLVKAQLARLLFDDQAYFVAVNASDPMVKAAVRAIRTAGVVSEARK